MICVGDHTIKPAFYTTPSSDLRYSQPLNMFMLGTGFSAWASLVVFTTRDDRSIMFGCYITGHAGSDIATRRTLLHH